MTETLNNTELYEYVSSSIKGFSQFDTELKNYIWEFLKQYENALITEENLDSIVKQIEIEIDTYFENIYESEIEND